MAENPDTQGTQSQSQGDTQQDSSQVDIADHFSSDTPNSTSYGSNFHDPSSSNSYVSQTVAYGTDINVPTVAGEVRKFFQTFMDEEVCDKPLYLQKVREMRDTGNFVLNINGEHFKKFNLNMYNQLQKFPLEMIQILDSVAKGIFESLFPNSTQEANQLQVRPYCVTKPKNVRDLSTNDIDHLICVQGMVTRSSPIIPDLNEAAFRCRQCNHMINVPVMNGRVQEPRTCDKCGATMPYELEHNYSTFADRQHLKVQESPESIPQGETPQSISAVCFDTLCDYAKPGDRIEITGIWRAMPARVNPRMRTLNAVYRTYIDAVHIRKILPHQIDSEEKETLDETNRTSEYSEKRKQKNEEYASDPKIIEKLIQSFAPSIWQMEEVKKGLLCMLFGGSIDPDGRRNDINILLVGDPATAKSQLIQYTHKVAPRGLYTSGKGSSAVGLTASVIRDPESGEFVLESGALVLSDRGVCCIDEFDKMSDVARAVLHEVMEQQTVSIAKAGIVCTLNARASIVACANPKDSQYNPKLSVVENIQLPPTLLSRFDLIYLILDRVDSARDMQLARHILGLYTSRNENLPLIPLEDFTDYIAYAKENCNPVFTDEAQRILTDGYLELRQLGGSKHVISATPRQLESMIRIAEAHAKMKLAETVEVEDAEFAFELMKTALHQSATDPSTGLIDMDLLTTGTSSERRARISTFGKEIIRMLQASSSGTIATVNIINKLREVLGDNVSDQDVYESLYSLEADSTVYLRVENARPVAATYLRTNRH